MSSQLPKFSRASDLILMKCQGNVTDLTANIYKKRHFRLYFGPANENDNLPARDVLDVLATSIFQVLFQYFRSSGIRKSNIIIVILTRKRK